MLALSEPSLPDRVMLSCQGTRIETVALPSPCWGATTHIAVSDGRLFVEHLAATRKFHMDMSVVYRSADDEQAGYDAGEFDLSELCERLVSAA